VGCVAGCSQGGGAPLLPIQVVASDAWQYPLRLGDTKGKVHELFTAPKKASPDTEEYPASGLTVLYDDDRRVTKLTFAGRANAVYSEASPPLLTERQILFGLTSHNGEEDFRRILGTPAREIQERSTGPKERHCVWKKGGYVVEAFFLSAESSRDDVKFPVGSLVRVEVYRGL